MPRETSSSTGRRKCLMGAIGLETQVRNGIGRLSLMGRVSELESKDGAQVLLWFEWRCRRCSVARER